MQAQSTTVTLPARICGHCHEPRPLTDFHDNIRNGTSGGWCRFCKRQWYRDHPRSDRKPKEPAPEGLKRCGRCKKSKPLDAFYPDSGRTDGKKNACIECSRIWTDDWVARNKARIAARIAAIPRIPMPPDTKECSRCKERKPLDRFKPDLRYRQDVTGWCRDCRRAYSAELELRKKSIAKVLPESAVCLSCGIRKPVGEFDRKNSSKTGIRSRCKECRQRDHAAIPNDDRKRRGKENRWRYFGLTLADIERMMIAQGGLCAICQRPMRRVNVDHCHRTGKVRGLLCTGCNTRLGTVEDREFLEKAEAYLLRYSGS